jgi:hypothetical protein
MLKEDFVIQSNIRRLLVSYNIDRNKIDIGTIRGVVYVRGFFKLTYNTPESEGEKLQGFTLKTLTTFEKRIRSLPGVSDIIFQLVDWKKEKKEWVRVEAKEEKEGDREGKGDSTL